MGDEFFGATIVTKVHTILAKCFRAGVAEVHSKWPVRSLAFATIFRQSQRTRLGWSQALIAAPCVAAAINHVRNVDDTAQPIAVHLGENTRIAQDRIQLVRPGPVKLIEWTIMNKSGPGAPGYLRYYERT